MGSSHNMYTCISVINSIYSPPTVKDLLLLFYVNSFTVTLFFLLVYFVLYIIVTHPGKVIYTVK
jgi:hypothetical protein